MTKLRNTHVGHPNEPLKSSIFKKALEPLQRGGTAKGRGPFVGTKCREVPPRTWWERVTFAKSEFSESAIGNFWTVPKTQMPATAPQQQWLC